MKITQSRNKREGYYAGTVRAYDGVKEIGRVGYYAKTVWKREYVRHARYKNRNWSLRGRAR